jgi:hypothetical protein
MKTEFEVTDGYLEFLEGEVVENVFERILRTLDYVKNACTDRKKLRKRYKFESKTIQNIIKNEFEHAEKATGGRFGEIRQRAYGSCERIYFWLKRNPKYGGISLEDLCELSSEGTYRRLAVKVCRDGLRVRSGGEGVS